MRFDLVLILEHEDTNGITRKDEQNEDNLMDSFVFYGERLAKRLKIVYNFNFGDNVRTKGINNSNDDGGGSQRYHSLNAVLNCGRSIAINRRR